MKSKSTLLCSKSPTTSANSTKIFEKANIGILANRKSLPSKKETGLHKKTSSSPGSSSHLFRQNSSTQYQSGISIKQSPGSNMNSAKSSSYYYATEPHNTAGNIFSRKSSECGINNEAILGLLNCKSPQGNLKKTCLFDSKVNPTHHKRISQPTLMVSKEIKGKQGKDSSSPGTEKKSKERGKLETDSKKRTLFNPNINYQKRLHNLLKYENLIREQNEANKCLLEDKRNTEEHTSPRVELMYNRGQEGGSSNILINPTKSWIQINNYLGVESHDVEENIKEDDIINKRKATQQSTKGIFSGSKLGLAKNINNSENNKSQTSKGKSNEGEICGLDVLTNHEQIINDLKVKKLCLLDLAKLMKENGLLSFPTTSPNKASSSCRPVSARNNKSMRTMDMNVEEEEEKVEEPKGSAKGTDMDRNFKYLLNNVRPESLWTSTEKGSNQHSDKRNKKQGLEKRNQPEKQVLATKLEEFFGVNMKMLEGAKKNKKLQELSRRLNKGNEYDLKERRNTVDDVKNYKSEQLKLQMKTLAVASVPVEEDTNKVEKAKDLQFMFCRMQKLLNKYKEREKSWEVEREQYKSRISILENLLREKNIC